VPAGGAGMTWWHEARLDYLKTFAEADDSPTRRAWASGMRAHGHDAGKWMPFDVWAHRRLLSTRMECSGELKFR